MSTKAINPDDLGPHWREDTISQSHTPSADVIYEGSDDEYYPSAEERQNAYIAAGYRYLQGRAPVMLSTSLYGPFDASSGWINPWGSRTPNYSQKSSHEIACARKLPQRSSLSNVNIFGKAPPKQPNDSQESHLPSPESLKHASAASTPHRCLDEESLTNLKHWRDGVCDVEQRDTSRPPGDASNLKRKSGGSEWIKKFTTKRQKTRSDPNMSAKATLNRIAGSSFSQPPRRGFRVTMDDPLTLSFRTAPGRMETLASSSTFKSAEQKEQMEVTEVIFRSPSKHHKRSTLSSSPKRLYASTHLVEEEFDVRDKTSGILSPKSPCTRNPTSYGEQMADQSIDQILPGANDGTERRVTISTEVSDNDNDDELPGVDLEAAQKDAVVNGEVEAKNSEKTSAQIVINVKEGDQSMMGSEEVDPATTDCQVEHSSSRCPVLFADPQTVSKVDESDTSAQSPQEGEAVPTGHMSLDTDESVAGNLDEQALVDAMVLDQLTQSICDSGNESRRNGPEDESMCDVTVRDASFATAPLDSDQDTILVPPTRSVNMEVEESLNTPPAAGKNAGGHVKETSSDMLESERILTTEGDIGASTSDDHFAESSDVAHFSFSALVSRLVPMKSWSSFGSFRRVVQEPEAVEGTRMTQFVKGERDTQEGARMDVTIQPISCLGGAADMTTRITNDSLLEQDVLRPLGQCCDADGDIHVAEADPLHSTRDVERMCASVNQPVEDADTAVAFIDDSMPTGPSGNAGASKGAADMIKAASHNEKRLGHSERKPSISVTNLRSKTPEPCFSIKSMASFMSPSPQRKPLRPPFKAARYAKTPLMVKPALKSRWSASDRKKHVSWALLPDEEESHGPKALRQSSPPPENARVMGSGEDTKFEHHFAAVTRRINGEGQNWQPRSHSRLQSSGTADCSIQPDLYGSEEGPAIGVLKTDSNRAAADGDMDLDGETAEEPMDIVEDVFKEMTELLQTWDVEAELDIARKHSSSFVARSDDMFETAA